MDQYLLGLPTFPGLFSGTGAQVPCGFTSHQLSFFSTPISGMEVSVSTDLQYPGTSSIPVPGTSQAFKLKSTPHKEVFVLVFQIIFQIPSVSLFPPKSGF